VWTNWELDVLKNWPTSLVLVSSVYPTVPWAQGPHSDCQGASHSNFITEPSVPFLLGGLAVASRDQFESLIISGAKGLDWQWTSLRVVHAFRMRLAR
jgi:hypothetical protein